MTLDPEVAARVKSEIRRSGRSLRSVINDALKRGLGMRSQNPRPPRFEVHPHPFGFRAGIDLDRLNQLADELDAAAAAQKLRS